MILSSTNEGQDPLWLGFIIESANIHSEVHPFGEGDFTFLQRMQLEYSKAYLVSRIISKTENLDFNIIFLICTLI